MEAFREIDIFRTPPPMSFPYICSENDAIDTPLPRMTRVCTKCLTSFTPWIKYDFVCRRFKCETRLVPSDIAERKRYCLLASSRSPLLKILPEDGLAAVIDFLGGDELCNLFRTSSSMCIVAERVARTRVEEAADQFPSGPICVSARKCVLRENDEAADRNNILMDPRTELKQWVYASNEHDFELRAPDDSKTWTGLYHYLEKMTGENYYFDFEDGNAVCRFIAQPMEEKFAFAQSVYSNPTLTAGQRNLVVNRIPQGMTVKGGQVVLFDESNLIHSKTFVSNQVLALSGNEKQWFIGRIFCPGSGSLSPPTRGILGTVGFVRIHRSRQLNDNGEPGPDAKWLNKINILESWLKDDSVFGIQYDASNRSMNVRTFGFSGTDRSQSSTLTIAAEDVDSGDDIVLAIELNPKAAKEHTMLSVRKCDSNDVWVKFLEHLPDEVPQLAADMDIEAAAVEAVIMHDDGVERGNVGLARRIRRRVDRMRGGWARQPNDNRHGVRMPAAPAPQEDWMNIDDDERIENDDVVERFNVDVEPAV